MRSRSLLIALAAGLALADASIVTLALPELRVELDTTVVGVGFVIAIYAVALTAALIPAERLSRQIGAPMLGAGGFVLFGLASLLCGAADTLWLLLLARALQAVGGAAALIAAFELLHGERTRARDLWLGAAVLSAAVGPALGGAVTEALNWRWIFFVQVAPALAGAAVAGAWRVTDGAAPASGASRLEATSDPAATPDPAAAAGRWRAYAALCLVSAALTAVLFGLVLLLVVGWAIAPLAGAATVTILPVAAIAGSRLGGDVRWRAAGGCALVGIGTIALAYLPSAAVYWTFAPQALAGLGMGLALPALAGELLPERNAADAANLLTLRHAGIAVAVLVAALIVNDRLENATRDALLQGTAVVLDARIDPQRKLALAPALSEAVESETPRDAITDAFADERGEVGDEQLPAYDALADRVDDVVIESTRDSFFPAFLVTGAFALAGAALLLTRARAPTWLPATVAAGVAIGVVQLVLWQDQHAERVQLADPCVERPLPSTGGLGGGVQDVVLRQLDRQACRLRATREELALAVLAGGEEADRFERKYGERPSAAGLAIGALFGG